ncbi:cytochrome P450 [Nocardia sp. NPDC050378]|uniref:cytochrome P450 n=1 Tax=Nocardia sp. NPDC050378 TaxID=3155400 RepID=UPI0033DBBBA4
MTANLLDSLDVEGVDFAFEDIADVHAMLARLRTRRPFAVVPFAGVRAVLLLTNELVSAAFKDESTFPPAAVYRMTTQPVLGKTLQCMEGAEHRIARGVATPPFRRNKVSAYVEPLLEPIAHELIDRFQARGHADLIAEFTNTYPVLVISRLLGLPIEDETVVHRWAHDLFYFPMDPQAAMRASREFTDYVTPLLAERRREPGDDLISMLVTESSEGQFLDDEQVLSFLRLLFPAGADTTMLALGNTLSALLTHPDQLALLESDLDEHTPWAVWEGLRWEPPVGLLPRACPAAVEWNGIAIPALTPMIFSINAALRDPAVYERPDEFDISRRKQVMLAFGQGPHSCAGNWLAIAELTTALKVLLQRLPGLRLQPGADADAKVISQVGTALRGPTALHVGWRA